MRAEQRLIDIDNHPLFNPDRLYLDTVAIADLKQLVHRWLWTGSTGATILGDPRSGKTTAIKTISTDLRTRADRKIPTFCFRMPRRDINTIKGLLREMCFSAELVDRARDTASHYSDRYMHYMLDAAVVAESNICVLFVDEMQRLSINQLDVFAELHDRMDDFDIRLVVIFIGNDPESWRLINTIQDQEHEHIRGRFFIDSTRFDGLKTKKELKVCLKQIDRVRFPEDGPTLTEYVLPDAVAEGWKVEAITGELWSCYKDIQREYHISSWRMKYFSRAICMLLTDFAPRYGVENIDEEMIHECIRLSKLVPASVTKVN